MLPDELELLVPGRSTTRAANEALSPEFIDEHPERIAKAVQKARQRGGDLNPWGLYHCRGRIRPRGWQSRD